MARPMDVEANGLMDVLCDGPLHGMSTAVTDEVEEVCRRALEMATTEARSALASETERANAAERDRNEERQGHLNASGLTVAIRAVLGFHVSTDIRCGCAICSTLRPALDLYNVGDAGLHDGFRERAESAERALASETERREEAERRAEGLAQAFRNLIEESRGVDGLHLNGEVADWEWLQDHDWIPDLGPAPAALSGASSAPAGEAHSLLTTIANIRNDAIEDAPVRILRLVRRDAQEYLAKAEPGGPWAALVASEATPTEPAAPHEYGPVKGIFDGMVYAQPAAERGSGEVAAMRESAARVVELADLFWYEGDPRARIAAKIRALPAPSPGTAGKGEP